MPSVFVLQHVHSSDRDEEDVKLIGVYSSREQAEAAVLRLSVVAGFSDARDGFHIDEYQLDRDHWSEGYASLGTCAEAAPGGTAR